MYSRYNIRKLFIYNYTLILKYDRKSCVKDLIKTSVYLLNK